VTWLGRPAFLAGINDFLVRYRFGSADLADLLDCLSRASGTDMRDLRGWAGRWLGTAGVDTLRVSRPGPAARTWSVTHRGGRPHRIWLGVYDPDGAGALALRARVPVLVPAGAQEVTLPSAAIQPEPALVLPNDGDAGYCKIRLDPASLITLTASLGRIADPLNRAVAWNSVRDLVRDSELPPQDYLALAVRHLAAETDPSIAGHVLTYARWTVTDRYLAPGRRGPALADLTGLCQGLLARPAGDDGAGLRLIAARTLIDSACRPGDIAALRSWLEAGQLPGGPDLDSRLRWQILLRLAVLGALGADQLDREASADGTAAGRLSAARCRAARPGETAKQAAWTAMFGDRAGAGSGYQLAATAQGFWQADQAGLLAGYLPRYFPALAEVAGRGDADLARVLCQHGFPHYAVDAATLRAGEECLADGELTGSLARLAADQLADLRRSLTVRSLF
jgi:aminopeptidase N